jgi:hypothetical protein
MPYLLCRMQKSLGRTLLTRSMTSQLRKMSLRSPKLRSERYVQRPKHSLKLPSHHRLVNVEQRPGPKTAATKPASKKAKPASGRAKKAKPTDEGEED